MSPDQWSSFFTTIKYFFSQSICTKWASNYWWLMFLHYITKCDPDVCSKKLSAMYDKQFWLSCVDECRWLQQLSLVSCIQWLLNISWPVLEQTWSPLELRYQWSQVVSDDEGEVVFIYSNTASMRLSSSITSSTWWTGACSLLCLAQLSRMYLGMFFTPNALNAWGVFWITTVLA